MVEELKDGKDCVDEFNGKYAINIRMSAKREFYGDYSCKADTIEELETMSHKVKQVFLQHM